MAKFNLTITVPDDKVAEVQQMIDDRLNSAYGYVRVTTDEHGKEVVNYTYVEWLELLIKEKLRAHYKGWKLKQLKNNNIDSIETDKQNTIT